MFFIYSYKNFQRQLHSTIISNYNYTILQGRDQEEPNYTTTPWLPETKRGQYKKRYAKEQ